MLAKAKIALALAGLLAGCLPQQPDLAYRPVSLQPPYSDLPNAPQGTAIEPGMPIKLDPRQQEAVIAAVTKWMKEQGTASFSALNAVKAQQGKIVVCGEVNGRNSAGAYPGMAPFVGITPKVTAELAPRAGSRTPAAAGKRRPLPNEAQVRAALAATLDNVARAAERLGIGRNAMYRRMEKFGIPTRR